MPAGAQPPKAPTSLGASARASVLWGGGFTLLRDVAQFGVMLVLVRLLSPADYGTSALAQSIIGLFSVLSFNTIAAHALQLRNPEDVDWQAHFMAGFTINGVLFLLILLVAWLMSSNARFQDAALPLAALSTTFLVEIVGSLRLRMLETQHDWKRYRLLLLTGTLLALGVGLGIGLLGGGVWALIVQVPLFGVPAAIDLIWGLRWRPTWSWSWPRYRETVLFSINRVGAAAAQRGRLTVEQSLLTSAYSFSALGVFTRSVGLATLLSGRLGAIAMASLYPVITRAEPGSPQFQRYAALVLRAVTWATAGSAIALALTAPDLVTLLYGAKWKAVIPLAPLAAAGVGVAGIAAAANSLLLANNRVRDCLFLDLGCAATGIVLAFYFVPQGVAMYLGALVGFGAFVLTLTVGLLWATGGISFKGVVDAFLPAAVAGALAAGAVLLVHGALESGALLVVRLGMELTLFSIIYLVVLRLLFPVVLRELMDVAPGGERIGRYLGLVQSAG